MAFPFPPGDGLRDLSLMPSIKSLCLTEPVSPVQQLRVDTNQEHLTSIPFRVLPSTPHLENTIEETIYRSAKEELLQKISKVDSEYCSTKGKISILKKRAEELEKSADNPTKEGEDEENFSNQTLAQRIYTENRRKALASHKEFEHLGPRVDFPVYNQPCDAKVMWENSRKHELFKERLVQHLRKLKNEREARQGKELETYSQLLQEWRCRVAKIESSAKWKAKESKNRDIFQKVFPDLKRQKEQQERLSSDMVRSAVIPPLLLDAKQRRYSYIDNNGKIEDFAAEYKKRQWTNIWTKEEVEIFKEKFVQLWYDKKSGKNFKQISSFLDRKSTQDCVQFYYLSKKEVNYKQLIRKSRRKFQGKSNNLIIESIISNEAGVMTRNQHGQLQKLEQGVPEILPSTLRNVDLKENMTPPLLTMSVTLVESDD